MGGLRPGITSDVFRHDAAVSNKVTGRHQIGKYALRLGVLFDVWAACSQLSKMSVSGQGGRLRCAAGIRKMNERETSVV